MKLLFEIISKICHPKLAQNILNKHFNNIGKLILEHLYVFIYKYVVSNVISTLLDTAWIPMITIHNSLDNQKPRLMLHIL